MFPPRYFAPRYFAPRYFPPSGLGAGAGLRRRRSILELARKRRVRPVDGREELVQLRKAPVQVPAPAPTRAKVVPLEALLPTAVPLEAFADQVERDIAELVRAKAAAIIVDEQALLLLLASL